MWSSYKVGNFYGNSTCWYLFNLFAFDCIYAEGVNVQANILE